MNLSSDIITLVSAFTQTDNLRMINKEINSKITLYNKSKIWKHKYQQFFIEKGLDVLMLKKSSSWKNEYIRVQKSKILNTLQDPSNIYTLDWSDQNIYNVPKEICNFPNLCDLNISYNNIENLPEELFESKELRYINISHNKLNNLPKNFTKMSTLRTIDVSFNNINIVRTLLGLKNIKIINNRPETTFDSMYLYIVMIIIVILSHVFIIFIFYVFWLLGI